MECDIFFLFFCDKKSSFPKVPESVIASVIDSNASPTPYDRSNKKFMMLKKSFECEKRREDTNEY